MLKKRKGVEKMRDNFNSQKEKRDLKNPPLYKTDDNSLFETIEFTAEDLKKIRQPNNQPLDNDYFDSDSVEQVIDNNQHSFKEADQDLITREQEDDSLSSQKKKGLLEAPEDNEFRYKSPIKAKLEEESKQAIEQENVEYWDEYERQEMDFWEHSSPVETTGQSGDKKQQTEARNKGQKNNPFKRLKRKNEIDSDTQPTIVERVKSLIDAKDAVEFNQFLQDDQDTIENDVDLMDESLSEKKTSLFNRAKNKINQRRTQLNKESSSTELQEEVFKQNFSSDSLVTEREITAALDKNETRKQQLAQETEASAESFNSNKDENELVLDADNSPKESETLPAIEVAPVNKLFEEDLKTSSITSPEEELVFNEIVTEQIENESIRDEEVDRLSEQASQETRRFSEPILTDQVLEEVLGNDDLTIDDALEQQSDGFVKGAAWLTIGSVFSRILGALYIIPWSTWLGAEYTQANTLYSAGYKPYSLFLAIATAGFPSAIAKQMAFYHSKKEYRVADKLFKNSIILMLVSGVISGGLLYLLAPSLAAMTSTDNPVGATMVIRSLVPALFILPLMSILRGYFQGFNDMVPSAISQIIEQIARVVYLLAATYAIMMVYRGEVTQAVVHSTFAAFVGALASLVYLGFLYFKRLPIINRLKERSVDAIQIDFKESMKIMMMDSVPFILLGSGIILAQLIDTYTFKQILLPTTVMLLREISELYGAMSLDVDKLVMIVVSLAVALATSVVPLITSKFAAKDVQGTGNLVEQIIELFSFVMLPAAIGMMGVSNNLYAMFYPQGHVSGPALLVTGSIMSIALGLYTVLSTVLQSMNFRRLAVRFLMIGLLVKLLLQVPFVAFFHAHGAMISTTIAFLVSSIFMWIKIKREVKIDTASLINKIVKILIGTVIMGITVAQWNSLLDLIMGDVGRLLTFVKVMLGVGVGIFVYMGIMGLFGQLSILIGDKYKDLQEKMRLF
ncbi:oligosaccharide flippase family protein [Aerococcaceae bacterium DSM 109653]|uniref:Oligosaccharide flippase family protein n=2 Tax=Fundicoccus ignavus TaxID=2664442 RepID=A0A844BN08_9LACT|nr:oligosaccharide flippase family protein [Fundicoccus ignavus]